MGKGVVQREKGGGGMMVWCLLLQRVERMYMWAFVLTISSYVTTIVLVLVLLLLMIPATAAASALHPSHQQLFQLL